MNHRIDIIPDGPRHLGEVDLRRCDAGGEAVRHEHRVDRATGGGFVKTRTVQDLLTERRASQAALSCTPYRDKHMRELISDEIAKIDRKIAERQTISPPPDEPRPPLDSPVFDRLFNTPQVKS